MIESAVAVAVALVCLAAALVLVRTRLPVVVKLLAAVVFLYGASVAATTGGGGFTAALDGAPFPALPYWLRAAYLDGQAILPLAVLVALVLLVAALIARKPRRAGLLLVLALVALGCTQLAAYEAGTHGLPTIVAFEAPAANAPIAGGAPCPDPTVNPLAGIEGWAPGAGHANQLGGSLGGAFGGGGNAAAGATPKPTAAPVITCTTDPGTAAFFARLDDLDGKVPHDETRVHDRAATLNSVDAAYAYVRDSIATEPYAGAMRGAFGTMMARSGSSADKALLLAALLGSQNVPVRYARTTLADAEIGALLKAPTPPPDPGDNVAGLIDDRAKATTVKVLAAQSVAIDAAVKSAGPAVDDLLARVAAAGTKVGGDATAARRAALRTHDWLQAQVNGAWTDLDPALSATAKGTHLGSNPVTAAALPDAAFSTIELRVFVDRSGARGATPAIDLTKHVADVAATPITVGLANRDAKLKELAAITNVTASVTAAGQTATSDAIPLADLDAVRLEIALAVPGEGARVYRRTLYRRTSGNASGDPAAATVSDSILVTSADYDAAFVDRHELDNLKALKPLIVWSTEHRTGSFPAPPAAGPEPFPIEAMRYTIADAQARARIAQTLAPGSRFVYDRPSIALVRKSFSTAGKALRAVVEFDIVDNGMAVVGGDAQQALRANAVRGAIDTNIERHVIGEGGPGDTRALFDAAKAAGVSPVVIAPGAGDPTAAVVLDPDARAHLADSLALHDVAIVPQHAVALNGAQRSGWWALDPLSGDLVGRMEDGAGQGEVEYVMARLNDDATLYAMIQFYGDFFRCIAMGVEAPLSGAAVNGPNGTGSCMESALCNYLESLTFGFGIDGTLQAFIYTLLDITFYQNTPGLSGKQNSLAPGGAFCHAVYQFSF
jgi:transglutaminase-like putative cysteine protease